MTENEILRVERDQARARYEVAVQHLTHIYALLNPPITAIGDKRYRFVNPEANETLQALSDAIRAIPEELRAKSLRPEGEFAKDAARYRWLKSLMKEDAEGWRFPEIAGAPSLETVDDVIDASLTGEELPQEQGKS